MHAFNKLLHPASHIQDSIHSLYTVTVRKHTIKQRKNNFAIIDYSVFYIKIKTIKILYNKIYKELCNLENLCNFINYLIYKIISKLHIILK